VTLHKNGCITLDLAPLEHTPVEVVASSNSSVSSSGYSTDLRYRTIGHNDAPGA